MSDYQTLRITGEYHLALGETEEAVACFKQAMDLDSNAVEPLLGLAAACIYEGEFNSALTLYMKAAAMEKDARAHAGIGLVLAEQGEVDDSFTHFLMALSIDLVNKVVLNGLLQLGYSTERLSEVIPAFAKALEENGDDHAVRFSYATCLFSTDNKEECVKELQTILQADPEHTAAKEVLQHIAA